MVRMFPVYNFTYFVALCPTTEHCLLSVAVWWLFWFRSLIHLKTTGILFFICATVWEAMVQLTLGVWHWVSHILWIVCNLCMTVGTTWHKLSVTLLSSWLCATKMARLGMPCRRVLREERVCQCEACFTFLFVFLYFSDLVSICLNLISFCDQPHLKLCFSCTVISVHFDVSAVVIFLSPMYHKLCLYLLNSSILCDKIMIGFSRCQQLDLTSSSSSRTLVPCISSSSRRLLISQTWLGCFLSTTLRILFCLLSLTKWWLLWFRSLIHLKMTGTIFLICAM